jgi:DNA-binding XRE family transcriptional regulator
VSVAGDAPNIRAVRAEKGPRKGDRVAITWKGGAESLVDLSDHLANYQSLVPLRRDKALFRRVTVGDWGWSLHWSDAAEISADTLWRLALEQGGAWLRDWRAARDMTQAEAARALGVSPRMWRYYEAGTHLLPKTVKLAAVGWDAEAHAA